MSIDQDVRSGLAAELDALAPGAGLVDALERLSPATLTGEDLASYVRACARAQSQAAAGFLEAIHHLGRAQAGRTDRRPELDEFSGDEISAILGWSRTMSGRKLDLADDLFGRLPEVGDALRSGWLDEPKAQRFGEWTRDLADDHARLVCSELLPEAPELPVGELIRRIEETAAALDPEWAKRRQKRAEKNARVILSPNPSGTATLSICDVNAVDGLSMRDRVDALAAAVRGLGVLIPVGALRAAAAARLLDGSVAGLDDRHVALRLAAEYRDPPPSGPDDGPGSPEDGPDDSGPDDSGPDDSGPDDSGPDDSGPDDSGPDDGPDRGRAPSGRPRPRRPRSRRRGPHRRRGADAGRPRPPGPSRARVSRRCSTGPSPARDACGAGPRSFACGSRRPSGSTSSRARSPATAPCSPTMSAPCSDAIAAASGGWCSPTTTAASSTFCSPGDDPAPAARAHHCGPGTSRAPPSSSSRSRRRCWPP